MFSTAAIFIAIVIAAYLVRFLKNYLRVIYLSQGFAGPPALPLFGNIFIFFNLPPAEAITTIHKIILIYGKTIKFWIGTELLLLMSELKDIEIVLGTMQLLEKSSEYSLMRSWLHEGLLISLPKKWAKRRKVLTPAFHFSILEQFIKTFDRESSLMVQCLNQHVATNKQADKGVELGHFINLITLDVICGPPALPFIGNIYVFFNLRAEEAIATMYKILLIYGNTVKFWIGTELTLLMSDPKDIEFILGNMQLLQKSSEYSLMRSWLHEGLLLSLPRKWAKRRKVLTPAFHFSILEEFVKTFDRESSLMLQSLRQHVDAKKLSAEKQDEAIELGHFIHLMTLDVICKSAMGVSIHAQTNADSEYVKAVKTISTVLHKRMFDIFYRFDLTYKFTKLARDEKRALAILHGFTEKIIVQRRAELLKAASAANNDDAAATNDYDIGVKRKLAFLDILLQSEIDGKPLSNLDIREEVDTFMFEGHDTTSSAITFFFYNIALYPKCQQKCFEEVLSIFGSDKEKQATYEDLNNMHYIELCIKETLRLFPSVPILGRKVTQECVINGKTIPAGTNIGITPLHIGRLEELFPNASKFIPERFDVVTSADKMSPYAYIPFSAGPRNCIGQKFAMLEIKSVVSKMLRHYVIEYAGDPSVEPVLIAELILRTKDPLMFRIKPRIY